MNTLSLLPSAARASTKQRVLEAIRQHFRDTGMSPSFREIGFRVGIAAQRVGPHIQALQIEGYLAYLKGTSRSIVLVDRAANLSDTELRLGCVGRGWTLAHLADQGLPSGT
jgi:SOS-response transcriptional repressor LexA